MVWAVLGRSMFAYSSRVVHVFVSRTASLGFGKRLKLQRRTIAFFMPIPAMPITHSDLMAITIPSDADHRRSEATRGCSYHAEVIGIRQAFCC
jgi:hypothetical protein